MKEKSFDLRLSCVVTFLCIYLATTASAFAQSDTFTYQGRLADSGLPASGLYDIEFRLFEAATGNSPIATRVVVGTTVTNGTFTAQVSFLGCPACFLGPNRFLELGVRPTGNSTFTTLSPRSFRSMIASPPRRLHVSLSEIPSQYRHNLDQLRLVVG